jgi:two-component system cell cycle response regulator
MPESLNVLSALAQDMLDAHDCQARLQLVTDFALRLSPAANHASVRLTHADADALQVGARSGIGAERPAPGFRKGQGLLGWVAETGLGARVDDSSHDPRFDPNAERDFPVSSLVSVPIRARGVTLGVLTLSASACNAFTDDDELVAQLLAQAAAQALLTAELERRTITDAHTLAFNRSYLFPRVNQEIERAKRGTSLSVLLIDLDHFKNVNDRFGHPVGDELLRVFADTTRANVRASDVLVRRGGEEFVLIMPDTSESEAAIVAERLRERVATRPLIERDGLCVAATISVGIASWDGLESAESLDGRADLAMYEAKQCGRNRCVRARRVQPRVRLCGGER